MQAVQQVFPGCCMHFEDWKGTDALRLLNRYKDKVLCYNDDIQGTASIVLAGLTTALQIIDAPLTDQCLLFLGAGSAGIGIANMSRKPRRWSTPRPGGYHAGRRTPSRAPPTRRSPASSTTIFRSTSGRPARAPSRT